MRKPQDHDLSGGRRRRGLNAAFFRLFGRRDIGDTRLGMTVDGQRKLFASILGFLGLGLFVAVKFAPLPHRPTSSSALLLVLAFCLLFAALRLMPDPQRDEDEDFARWADEKYLAIFAVTLALLGYGLWAMIAG